MSKTEDNEKVLPINGYGYRQYGYPQDGNGAGYGERYGYVFGGGLGSGHQYDSPIIRLSPKRPLTGSTDGDGEGFGSMYGYENGDGDNTFNEDEGDGIGTAVGTPSEF